MITVSNQRPVELTADYVDVLGQPFNHVDTVENLIIKPMFTPLVPSAPVTMDENGTAIGEKEVAGYVFDCCDDQVNNTTEAKVKEIFIQCLANYEKVLTVQEVYAIQAGLKNKMYMPSDRVIYNEADVIDASRQLLSGQIGPEAFFANLAFYARLKTLGFYFANDAAWQEFKKWLNQELNNLPVQLTPTTANLFTELQKINLSKLTESFILRGDVTQNNEEYSFARLFRHYLATYSNIQKTANLSYLAGILPFSFSENVCPTTIVIVNVEKHAHAHPADIKKEYTIIQNALAMKPKVLSLDHIKNLDVMARMSQRMSSMAAVKANGMWKSAMIKFRPTPPTSVDIYKAICKIYENTKLTIRSENTIKLTQKTYSRPSRRRPDDPDAPGKVRNIKFKPDLHIYLDCSGSISERQYQDAMKSCIKLAKKMNINIYFNSFSHILSATTKLHIKGKSTAEIYDEFKKTPKVGGGTDFEQIWHYINRSQKREHEVSLLITDFGYYAPNHYVKHPKFLYYAPISQTSWSSILRYAEDFTKSMAGIAPDIRKKILIPSK